jgi:uncharacterized protein (DUF305 family)
MRHRRFVPTVAVLAAALLTACSGADAEPADEPEASAPIVQPGAPGEPSELVDELPEAEEPRHTEADVAFMQGMIPHHVQALRMTRLVPERTAREDVPLFAERMDISQEDELTLMRDWLEERDEEVPLLSVPHDHPDADQDLEGAVEAKMDGPMMPGMLTEDELLALEAAEGEEFDRLFLEAMIRHHEGALTMVDELFEAGGGQGTEVFQFAGHVRSDQEIEISRMQDMLEDLG